MLFGLSARRTVLFPLAFVLMPLLARAQDQTAPPAEIDQVLRERATLFLQNQVDGNFRKSFDLVAEESKDWYFASAKAKIISFKIESIEYSDQFTKATVKSSCRRTVSTLGQSFTLDLPITDHWKIEDGKWFWYRDSTLIETPFGVIPAPSAASGEAQAGAGPSGLPTDLSPAAVAAAAAKLTSATTVDKKAIAFNSGAPSVEELVFHNGAPGLVRLLVDKATAMDSVSVDVTEVMVKPGQDVRVKVSYMPDESGVKSTTIRLTVEPFGTVYAVPVTLRAK